MVLYSYQKQGRRNTKGEIKMKKTYTRTLFIENLEDVKVRLFIYDGCKYTAKSVEDLGEETEVIYNGIKAWDVIEGGEEAEEIESDADIVDEFHEYLVLHLLDGNTATFRNSHVDMFLR